MSVVKLDDKILTYRLYDEKSSAVLYYTLNLDKYSLTIGGEVAGYYKWIETPKTESFLELMVRCDSGYITNKLFNNSFDLEKSIKSVIDYIKEYALFDCDYEEEVQNYFIEKLEGLDCDCAVCFVNEVCHLLDDYFKDIPLYVVYDLCEYGHKYWEKKSVDLFCEVIVPELKKELQN